jgi:hypothetical protein
VAYTVLLSQHVCRHQMRDLNGEVAAPVAAHFLYFCVDISLPWISRGYMWGK